MKIPDELLSAFVNGELDGAERQRIELAIAHDRRVAQRVAKQRALRSRLPTALDDVLRQPARQARGHAPRLRPGSAQIIDLARVRAERAHLTRHRRTLVTSARVLLTAVLIIGIAAGAAIARLSAESSLTQYRNGLLLAHGPLARALNEQITGHASSTARIRVSATYRSRNGSYCRTFTIAGSQSLAGLACRERNQWQLQTLLNNATGAAPAQVLELNQNLSDAALTTAAEIALRSHDWQ